MPSGPAQPPPPERSPSANPGDRTSTASSEPGRVELGAEQHYGPLTIARVVKDDGRSLILYGHDEPQPEPGAASARELRRRDDRP